MTSHLPRANILHCPIIGEFFAWLDIPQRDKGDLTPYAEVWFAGMIYKEFIGLNFGFLHSSDIEIILNLNVRFRDLAFDPLENILIKNMPTLYSNDLILPNRPSCK